MLDIHPLHFRFSCVITDWEKDEIEDKEKTRYSDGFIDGWHEQKCLLIETRVTKRD